MARRYTRYSLVRWAQPVTRLQTTSLVLLGLFGGIETAAIAQPGGETDTFINQQRMVRQRIWDQIEEETTPVEAVDFDYGGAYSFNLFLFDDGIESSRTLRRHDLRLWSRLSLEEGAHEFYVRGLVSFLDWNTGDAYDFNDDDWQSLSVDRAYYQFDLRRLVRAREQRDLDYNLRFKVGRDLVTLGTGLTLSLPLDHVSVQGTWKDFDLTVLAARTPGSTFDIDRTRPTDRTRRDFFGAELRYGGWERHRPFAYVLYQHDNNDDTRWTPLQNFDYDSFYLGVGSRGELVDNLFYETEWVYEWGRSYGDRRVFRRDDIHAWAFDVQLEYLFDAKTHPRASIEYMFASGDPDRWGSPTDAYGGNRRDHTDNSFVAFGYRDTGVAFAPTLSNIHIWRAGASFFPLEGDRRFDRLELGTNWFLYHKNRGDAAVSDPTADLPSGYLGWEMDYFASWAITNDLSWTVRYGVFFPGDAFSDQTTRTFVLTGVTWSF